MTNIVQKYEPTDMYLYKCIQCIHFNNVKTAPTYIHKYLLFAFKLAVTRITIYIFPAALKKDNSQELNNMHHQKGEFLFGLVTLGTSHKQSNTG